MQEETNPTKKQMYRHDSCVQSKQDLACDDMMDNIREDIEHKNPDASEEEKEHLFYAEMFKIVSVLQTYATQGSRKD